MTAHITVHLILHLLVFPRDLLLLLESFRLDDNLERASFHRPQLHGLPLDGIYLIVIVSLFYLNNTCLSLLSNVTHHDARPDTRDRRHVKS